MAAPHADGRAAGAPELTSSEVERATSQLRSTGVDTTHTACLHTDQETGEKEYHGLFTFDDQRARLETLYDQCNTNSDSGEVNWTQLTTLVMDDEQLRSVVFIDGAALARVAPETAKKFSFGAVEGYYVE
jgi:hypothetical protein